MRSACGTERISIAVDVDIPLRRFAATTSMVLVASGASVTVADVALTLSCKTPSTYT